MSQKRAVTKNTKLPPSNHRKFNKNDKRPKNSFKQDIILKNIISSAAGVRIRDDYPGSEIFHPGSGSWFFTHPGVEKAQDPGSGSATLISCLRGGRGGGQPCLPFRRRAKPDDLDHGDGEVLAGAERRIVEGATRLRPPEFQVRIQVDSRPVPCKKKIKGIMTDADLRC